MLTAHVRKLRELSPLKSVRLLPAFNKYVIGASYHAEHLLPGVLRSRVYRPQGWISPVLLVNGFMQGVWRHEIKGNRVEVVIEPFIKLPSLGAPRRRTASRTSGGVSKSNLERTVSRSLAPHPEPECETRSAPLLQRPLRS